MIFLVLASIPLAKVKKFQTLAKKHAFLIQKFRCNFGPSKYEKLLTAKATIAMLDGKAEFSEVQDLIPYMGKDVTELTNLTSSKSDNLF